ncbi:MAG: hypothetical protein ACFHWZ_08200 [Phycisphaerales bacterium]
MTRAGEKWKHEKLLMIGFTLIVAIGGLVTAAAWFIETKVFPGPTESLAEYPAYQSFYPSPAFDFLPQTIPIDAADAAVQLWPGVLQAPTSIQLRLVWPDQNAFASELQRLEALDQTQAIRAAESPNEEFMLMAQTHTNTTRLQWIGNLQQWLAHAPDRRIILMHCDTSHEQTGAVAICPATLTIYYCAVPVVRC